MIARKFESDYVLFEIEDNVLHTIYKVENITEEIAREIIKQKIEFLDGKSYPTLLMDSGNIRVSKKARTYFSSEEGMRGLENTAFITTNKVNLFVAKFFLKVNNAQRPFKVKVFNTKAEALEWINETNDKN